MKINTDEALAATSGTCLQGYVDVSYDKLVATFGPPGEGDGYKVDAEWAILFDDGVVATVYNYKDGHNYNGEDGMAVVYITDWHIGGNNGTVVERIKRELVR